MRGLNPFFFKELKAGSLTPLLDCVKNDNTLDLEIRENYFNIYYRGGNVLKVNDSGKSGFQFHFEKKYLTNHPFLVPQDLVNLQIKLDWNKYIPLAKQAMDYYFTKHTKHEREFQQLVVRENNNSTIANGTDYFIIDIEYDNHANSRFDLIAIEWPSRASERKLAKKFVPKLVIIEMKYGDGAVKGNAGMIKHWNDFFQFVSDPVIKASFKDEMKTIFEQKRELGLIPCLSSSGNSNPISSFSNEIEFAFLIVNHDPESTKLNNEMSTLGNCNAKFIVSNFMGYGIFSHSIFDLSGFKLRYANQFS